MTTCATTAQEVVELFNVTEAARQAYASWAEGRRKHDVVPHVRRHRTEVLYGLTLNDVRRVCDTPNPDDHALGDVRRSEGEKIESIRDWEPDFAFTHVLHFALETLGHLPTWTEFRLFCEKDRKAQEMLWKPAQEKIRDAVATAGCTLPEAHMAMRWRVGNSYYSFLREIHLITCLRAEGLDVRFHPLADALYRVDAWCGRVLLSLYIGNAEFKLGNTEGRKRRTRELLGGADQRWIFETLQLKPADTYGRVHLVSSEEVKKVAQRLRSLGGRLRRSPPCTTTHTEPFPA